MTDLTRTRPDVPNGKPLGRHVDTAPHRNRALARQSAPPAAARAAVPRPRRHKVALNAVTVMTVSAGIVATVALPSYAIHPDEVHPGGLSPATAQVVHQPQRFVVSPAAPSPDAGRDEFSATTTEELKARRLKKLAEERAIAEAKQAAIEAAVTGQNVEQVPAAPQPMAEAAAAQVPEAAPPAESGSIVAVARQYLGVPYVFGGASPAGFDCSGLVLYVYAQFGIVLPHSSLRQGANGIRVTEPAPGDLIVIDGGSHIGIYSGGGYMIDAPMPGRVVNERPIYTSNHFFVRY